MKSARLLIAAPVAVATLFFVIPLLLMLYASFVSSSGGLTFEHYATFFGDSYYLGGLAVTTGTALLVTVVTLITAYPVALLYWSASPRLKSLLIVLLLSPFYANIVVKVFGWMLLLPATWLNGYAGLLIVSVHRDLPFMVLLIAGAMARIDREWIESASTCGASRGRVLRTIIWPLSIPGVVSGSTLVFSLTMAAYVVPAIIGGPWRGRFLPVLLYQQMTIARNWGFAAAIAAVLLLASLATIAAGNGLITASKTGVLMREDFDA